MKSQSVGLMEDMKEADLVRRSSDEISNQLRRICDDIARRAFELFESRGRLPGHELEDWIRAESELLRPVPVNVTESDDVFSVEVEVPGFASKDIQVIIEPLCLAISAKRQTKQDRENERLIRGKSRADQIFRVVDLPPHVDISRATTTLRNGILMVDLPKTRSAENERLEPVAA